MGKRMANYRDIEMEQMTYQRQSFVGEISTGFL